MPVVRLVTLALGVLALGAAAPPALPTFDASTSDPRQLISPLARHLQNAPAAQAAQGERYELAGDSVAVYDLVGSVSLVPGNGPSVVVTVRRKGADAARLRAETGPVRGVPALRIVYPSDEIRAPVMGRHSETTIDVREDGTFDDDRHEGRGRRVRISSDYGLEVAADLEIAVPAGRGVAMHLAVGEVTARNVNGRLSLNTASANVSASGMRGVLRVDVGSGDVRVSGGEGELSIDTGSGDVTVSDVRGRELSIDTGSGNVQVTGSSASNASIDTGSGDLTLTGFSGDRLELDTGSGTASVDLVHRVRELTIDTGSGDVTIRAPQDFGASVQLEASSGEVHTDFEVASAHRDDGELSGTIGDGSGRLHVETGSGDIQLLRR